MPADGFPFINKVLPDIFHQSKEKYKVLLPEKFTFFSPETFVEIRNQQIFTHPMKGTIDASVPNAVEELKNSVKEKKKFYLVHLKTNL